MPYSAGKGKVKNLIAGNLLGKELGLMGRDIWGSHELLFNQTKYI